MADSERLNALLDQAKQAAQELRTTLQPKLQELGDDVRQRVTKASDNLDQKLDEIGAAI